MFTMGIKISLMGNILKMESLFLIEKVKVPNSLMEKKTNEFQEKEKNNTIHQTSPSCNSYRNMVGY